MKDRANWLVALQFLLLGALVVLPFAVPGDALWSGQQSAVLAVLLMITGLAFALVGFSLDRVFNPRLRGL